MTFPLTGLGLANIGKMEDDESLSRPSVQTAGSCSIFDSIVQSLKTFWKTKYSSPISSQNKEKNDDDDKDNQKNNNGKPLPAICLKKKSKHKISICSL